MFENDKEYADLVNLVGQDYIDRMIERRANGHFFGQNETVITKDSVMNEILEKIDRKVLG